MNSTHLINRIIAETLDRYITNIITESQESKSIVAAKKLYMQRMGCSREEADEFVRFKLRNDLPALRDKTAAKFILGVTRMFLDGGIRDASTICQLNATLKYVASDAHINDYDRNLNGLSAQDLIQRFAKAITDDVEKDKSEINSMSFDANNQYDIIKIDSFEQASEYGDYTSWCITHDEKMFDSYTNYGINQFYFCLRKGFESILEKRDEGCPIDKYGLSMIAVSVDENGRLNTCTCRWNHDNGGNDSIMNAKQISEVVGVNFYQTFKPNNKWRDMLSDALQRLTDGEDPRRIFWLRGRYYYDGFKLIELGGRYNFMNQNNELLSDQWFTYASEFRGGLAHIAIGFQHNYIKTNGEFLSNKWFDSGSDMNGGIACVKLKSKINFINNKGEFISNQWFDYASKMIMGYACVGLRISPKSWKFNLINENGEFVFNQWFNNQDELRNASQGYILWGI